LKNTPLELSINLKSAKALSLNNTALATWRADASNETARFPLLAQSGYCLCIQSPVPRAAIALWRSGFLIDITPCPRPSFCYDASVPIGSPTFKQLQRA